MTLLSYRFVGLMALLAYWSIVPAAAQQTAHSWIASNGSGTACTRSAPCGSLAVAQDATYAGGVISILDSLNDIAGIQVMKSLTIRAEGVDGGVSTVAVTTPWILITAGSADVVTVEGVHLNGGGIEFRSGGHLHILKCVIANGNIANNAGIRFKPNSQSKLSVSDSAISNFGSGTGGGIVVIPQSGGTALVNLERVSVNGNAFGIAADGSTSTGGINMMIADSMVGGNTQDGIIAVTPAGGAPIGVMVENTKSVNNAYGIRVIGSGATVRATASTLTGNGTGLSFSSGGALLSFGNNVVQANGANGAFAGSVPLQ